MHGISRKHISENALKVLRGLEEAGFSAYLVGGCVRDLLLGHSPKDFDVVTDALPEQIKKLFRNCRLIGRRFRLAHVFFHRDIIEVATFRGTETEEQSVRSQHGLILRDNVYGTLEEDIWRRDLTINALYYNNANATVVDFCDGVSDLKAKMIRLIGDPEKRFREDPVRILRAIRFAAKFGFAIHPDTEAAMLESTSLLQYIAPSRLFEEVLKLFLGGKALVTYELLSHYGLFGLLFPDADNYLKRTSMLYPKMLLTHLFANTDNRLAQGKTINPAFLFAGILWYPLKEQAAKLQQEKIPEMPAFDEAMSWVIKQQIQQISIPRRFTSTMKEIWHLQARLIHRTPKRGLRTLHHPRFRAGYDFLLLRNTSGEDDLQELCEWWTELQSGDANAKKRLLTAFTKNRKDK